MSLSIDSRKQHRFSVRGFTLIELLVSMAVIAVLVALIVPAVQQARESARRAACQNNLKQIGIALHNYHDAHQIFPPGWVVGRIDHVTSLVDRGCLWSWSSYLLPMLEQQPLYEQLKIGEGADPPPPTDPRNMALEVFLCRSDSGGEESGYGLFHYEPSMGSSLGELRRGYAKSNYVAVNGRSRKPFDPADIFLFDHTMQHSKAEKGIFGFQTNTRMVAVRDGLGFTFAVGERDMSRLENGQAARGATWVRNFSIAHTEDSVFEMGNVGGNCNALSTTGVTHPDVKVNSEFSGRFSSSHDGGAYFLLADGSVKFISENIDTQTYSLLGSMDDGLFVQF
ncbi:MAG TPA: DUF1559 domain-containing protein [Planctomycetaceae bacterium]|nr:DUF1559 domain-containing protein [Planctomycetaceae bacterium]